MEIIHGMRSSGSASARIALNGREPTLAELALLAQLNYGHFTTMQVRDRSVRGFGLHLQRLGMATRELFGSDLDIDRVRAEVRQLLDDEPTSLRITVFSRALQRNRLERSVAPDVLIATTSPHAPRNGPLRLQSLRHERVLPRIKHIGMFDVLHLWRQARIAGFDDVVLTTAGAEIAEGSTWNIGFWDGRRVVWPSAPALPGITLQLLDAGLRERGIESVSRPVFRDQLAGFRSAFMVNSGSVGPLIETIDAQRFEVDDDLLDMLKEAFESQPMEII
ncbi:MAG: aminotransferase class IV [Xanthomonadales bacterium]|nr:aminotransferase class IV [Xanthomonadales bacterium]